MLRSNSRAAKTAVRKFIVESLRCMIDDDESMTDDELVRYFYDDVMRTLKSDKWHRTPAEKVSYNLDCGGWECGTWARRKLVEEWLQETPEESERFTDEQAEDMFKRLVTREVLSIAERG